MGIAGGMPLQTGIALYYREDVDTTPISPHLLATETLGWGFLVTTKKVMSQMALCFVN